MQRMLEMVVLSVTCLFGAVVLSTLPAHAEGPAFARCVVLETEWAHNPGDIDESKAAQIPAGWSVVSGAAFAKGADVQGSILLCK